MSETLAVAVDAVGADQVEVVMMPSRYTSDMSNDAKTMTIAISTIVKPVRPTVQRTAVRGTRPSHVPPVASDMSVI